MSLHVSMQRDIGEPARSADDDWYPSGDGPMQIEDATRDTVDGIFRRNAAELHRKVDATRDAYFGFIFPINRADFVAVTRALGLDDHTASALYAQGTAFSTFRPNGRHSQLTNHIVGSALLAMRERSLDTGLQRVADESLADLVSSNEQAILEIADARHGWFGRIFFPAAAFANAAAVFGARVSSEALWLVAKEYGFAGTAGERLTIRGDFGIGLWLTLLARA